MSAGDEIGRRRGHHHALRPAGQLDMPHAGLGVLVQELDVHRVAGHGLKCQRGNEGPGAVSHHHAHVGARVTQTPHQFSRLVGCDPPRYAQQNVLAFDCHLPSVSAAGAAGYPAMFLAAGR